MSDLLHRDLPEIVAALAARVERLEDCTQTARPGGAADPSPSGGEPGGAANGLRTERVVLEVTYRGMTPPWAWNWNHVITSPLVTLKPGESVRVVEEAKLAPAANADGGSNHAAPAASGAAVGTCNTFCGVAECERADPGQCRRGDPPAASGAAGTEAAG